MANGERPFQDADLEQIKARLKDLDEADAMMDKAQQAGIDVTNDRQRSRELRAQLTKIRQAFFTGR